MYETQGNKLGQFGLASFDESSIVISEKQKKKTKKNKVNIFVQGFWMELLPKMAGFDLFPLICIC